MQTQKMSETDKYYCICTWKFATDKGRDVRGWSVDDFLHRLELCPESGFVCLRSAKNHKCGAEPRQCPKHLLFDKASVGFVFRHGGKYWHGHINGDFCRLSGIYHMKVYPDLLHAAEAVQEELIDQLSVRVVSL